MAPLNIEDLLQYRYVSQPVYSPSGAQVAYTVCAAKPEEDGYRNDLWLLDAPGGESRALTQHGQAGGFIWMDEDQILYGRARATEEVPEKGPRTDFFALNTQGRERLLFRVNLEARPEALLPDGRFLLSADFEPRLQAALGGLSGQAYEKAWHHLKAKQNRRTVLEESPFWKDGEGFVSGRRRGLFLYTEADKTLRQLTGNDKRVELVRPDPVGRRIAYTAACVQTTEPILGGIFLYDIESGTERCLLPQGRWRVDDLDFAGGKIWFVGSNLHPWGIDQRPDLLALDPATEEQSVLCKALPPLGSLVNSDCRLGAGRVFCTRANRAFFIGTLEEEAHLYCWSPEDGLRQLLAAQGCIDFFDINAEAGHAACVALQNMALQELYITPLPSHSAAPAPLPARARRTAHNTALLAQKPPVKPHRLRVAANDGTEIHGCVLPPAGWRQHENAKAAYPAVLCIHGGPYTCYGPVYHHEMQLLAQEGYFVIFCNPRGSAGRADGFADIRGDFGGVDCRDILAFCDAALAAWPSIDPARLGVSGGSYGGFMANWLVTHSHRFAAAVSQRGISNFLSFAGTSDIGTDFTRLYELGSVAAEPEKLWRMSPLKYAQNCATPTLFIHADEDCRCPLEQALQMYTALLRQGTPARLALFHGQGHELSRSGAPKARMLRLREILDWLERYLHP